MKPTCCGEVVLNTVMGKDFYYCRECKKEVIESPTIAVYNGGHYDVPHVWDNNDECQLCGISGEIYADYNTPCDLSKLTKQIA